MSSGTASVTYGTTAGTACQGNDSRLSDARTPTAHAASHASAGSDPITVGTVSGRIVTTTTGGKLSTGSLADVVYGQSIAPSGLTVSPPNVSAGNYPADLIPFSITYDAAAVFQVNAVGDVGTSGVIEAGSFSGEMDASNLTGTLATARLGSGTASASTYLRGDQTWAAISAYTLPAATTSTLGGVIVGAGLSVSSGTVSANVVSVAGRTGTVTIFHSDVGNSPSTLTQFTAAQNNLSLGAGGIVRISSNAAINITGFAATSGGDARMLSNVGSFAITLKHSDAASAAANRILCVGNADVVIAAGGSAVVYYDATDSRWRVG